MSVKTPSNENKDSKDPFIYLYVSEKLYFLTPHLCYTAYIFGPPPPTCVCTNVNLRKLLSAHKTKGTSGIPVYSKVFLPLEDIFNLYK